MTWSKFETTFFDTQNIVSPERKWQTEIRYYKGDLSSVDVSTDWRFKEVPGKRKESKFLGLVDRD